MLPAWARGTLLLLVTFIAGAVVGMGYERRRAPVHEAARADHSMMHRLQHDLDLDSAQHAAIAAILARRQGTVDSAWHHMRPHLQATLDSALQEIVGVLRSDQAARYRRMAHGAHTPRSP